MTDQTEPYRFTDADGDYLHIGIPTSPTNGGPAISFHTLAEPVHVPIEEVEGLIAAVRRMTAAQMPAERPAPACAKCKTPFDETDTSFDGRAQQSGTPYCRRCVDRCHDSTDAFHVCAICR